MLVAWMLVGIEASLQKAVERAAAARSVVREIFRADNAIAACVAPSEREIASHGRSSNDSPARFINDADLVPDLGDGRVPYEPISPR